MAASAQAKELKKENIVTSAPTPVETSVQPNGSSNTQSTSVEDNKSPVLRESILKTEANVQQNLKHKPSDTKLIEAVKSMSLSSPMPPSLVVNGSGLIRNKSDGVDGLSEESGSDLGGTKPPSLDGKSFTSGTQLDEKESLRPDDSASVKAAEDDDAFSGRGSIVAGSYRAQFYERNMQTMHERQSQGVNTPQSGSSGQQTTDDGKSKPLIGTPGVPDAFNLFYRQTPDEKLLEALESPKDRIFLLRLEQDVIEFVKSSK